VPEPGRPLVSKEELQQLVRLALFAEADERTHGAQLIRRVVLPFARATFARERLPPVSLEGRCDGFPRQDILGVDG